MTLNPLIWLKTFSPYKHLWIWIRSIFGPLWNWRRPARRPRIFSLPFIAVLMGHPAPTTRKTETEHYLGLNFGILALFLGLLLLFKTEMTQIKMLSLLIGMQSQHSIVGLAPTKTSKTIHRCDDTKKNRIGGEIVILPRFTKMRIGFLSLDPCAMVEYWAQNYKNYTHHTEIG